MLIKTNIYKYNLQNFYSYLMFNQKFLTLFVTYIAKKNYLMYTKFVKVKHLWPYGQEVKTTPSHGVIWGSIPHRATKFMSLKCA